MSKILFVASLLIFSGSIIAQDWNAFMDSIPTLSSPRSTDLNNDGIDDIVIGGGTDAVFSNNGVMAYNGIDGSLLWKIPVRNEVYGSAIFQDITSDGIDDVFIAGRSAQLIAINGANGNVIWDYFPYGTNPEDSGLYNFYNPQFIDDVDGDSHSDILVSNGGDHSAPAWEENRPAGRLMVISSLTGNLIAQDTVPDGAEIYCSPVVFDLQNNGNKWILYGTGGENFGGHFYIALLDDLVGNNSLIGSIELASDSNKGFIAPASVCKKENGVYDIYIQSFGGKVHKIRGEDLTTIWTYQKPGSESSAAPTIANFTGDITPDVLLVLLNGIAPSYSDYYQVVLDGSTGEVAFIDSLGAIHFASANAADLNNDGRDEAIFAISYFESGVFKTRIEAFDFTSHTLFNLDQTRTGVTIGSTPLISDIDQDGFLDLIYSVKKDSVNPMGWKGIYIYRHELTSIYPNSGIAWGSYMGTSYNGEYDLLPVDCGFGSVLSGITLSNPSCNGFSDGQIVPGVISSVESHTYLWSNGSTESFLQNVPSGEYWVQVTNSLGCYEYSSVVLSDPFVISFGGISSPTCIGDTNGQATLNSTGCYCMFSTCTFLWENGITTKPNNQLHEGWNNVLITHSNGCEVRDSVFIASPKPVIDSIQVNNITVCFGDSDGSAVVFLNPASQSPSISWNTNEVNDSISGKAAGSYYVLAADNRPCRDSIAFIIVQPEELIFSTINTSVTCNGLEDASITFSPSGGTLPYTFHINSNSSLQVLSANLGAGSYNVFVEDQNGCNAEIQSVIITEPEVLSGITSVLSHASSFTSYDGIAECFVSGGTSPYMISWDDLNSQTGTLAVYLNPGWHTATVLDANGCTFEDSVYIGVASLQELNQSEQYFYPNPSTGEIVFNEQYKTVRIFDTNGSLVWQQRDLLAKVSLNLSSGVYMIELSSEQITIKSRLIVTR